MSGNCSAGRGNRNDLQRAPRSWERSAPRLGVWGRYPEQISPEQDGLLFPTSAGPLVDFVVRLEERREPLRTVAERLRTLPIVSVREMIERYYSLRPRDLEQLGRPLDTVAGVAREGKRA